MLANPDAEFNLDPTVKPVCLRQVQWQLTDEDNVEVVRVRRC